MSVSSESRARLAGVTLYLITDARPPAGPLEDVVRAAVHGGAGMVQLRERSMTDAELLAAASRCAATCRELGVPCIINDRVDIALACGADGVHVGQDDLPVHAVRALASQRLLVGLSTHSPEQVDRASRLDVDYIGVGPVFATPTKEGRPGVGTELVCYAAERARVPFFAIGGLNPSNVASVIAAGARGISVLRWVAHAADPAQAARALLAACERARRVSA